MNDEQWFEMINKKALIKNRNRNYVENHTIIRQDWTCDCGAKFKWYSYAKEQEHRNTIKHHNRINEKNRSKTHTADQAKATNP